MLYQSLFVNFLLFCNGLILNYLYFHFYDCRYFCKLERRLIKIIFASLFSILFIFIFRFIGYYGYLFISLSSFFLIRFFYVFEGKREYITQILFFVVLLLGNLFSSIFTDFIIRAFDMERNSMLELSFFSLLFSTFLIVVIYSFLNMKFVGVPYDNLTKKDLSVYVGSLFFSWVLCVILISFLFQFQDLLFQFFVCITILFVLMLNLFLIYNAQTKALNNKLEKEIEENNKKSDLLMKYYENVKKQEEENSIFRHDLKNHLSIIKDKIPTEMDNYVNELLLHVNKESIRFYSDHKVLEALINDKMNLAKKKDIHLDVKCDDTHIGVLSDYDLVTVLSNLIDNAIEAVMLSDFHENQIQLRIKDLKGKLIIKIKNSYNGVLNEQNDRLISTKNGHSGLGLKSVQSVVAKYQGDMNVTTENHQFLVIILIPFHTKKSTFYTRA